MLVVLCAVIGSLTVLPAALAKLGDRVDRGRVPYIGRRKQAAGDSRFWALRARAGSCAGPLSRSCSPAGCCVVAASPLLSMHTKLPSFTDMPRDLPIVKTYERVIAAFPGAPTPAEVVIRADDVRTPAVAAGIQSLEGAALATGVDVQPDRRHHEPRRDRREGLDSPRRERRQPEVARGARHAAADRAAGHRSATSKASSTR